MDDEWGKFKEYAKKNESGARAIGHELALLSYTLCNASKLLSKYGLRLKDQHRHQRYVKLGSVFLLSAEVALENQTRYRILI